MLGGAGATLALGAPMIAEGINYLTGWPVTLWLQAVIMLVTASDNYESPTIHIERWKKKKKKRSALEVLKDQNPDPPED